jgi:hypothetical protein
MAHMRHRIVTLILLVAGACGGSDERDYGDPITIDTSTKTSLTSAISAAAALVTIENAPSSDSALSAFAGFSSAYAVLTPACQSKIQGAAFELSRDAMFKPVDMTCVTIATGKVTYNNCNYGGGSINGSISYGAGMFTMDVTVSIGATGSTTTVKQKGSIAVSATAIKGNMDIDVSGSFGGTTVNAGYDADFDVTLASGCATGGFVEVAVSGSASGQGGSGSYNFGAKAEFGPSCGDIRLYCAK